MKKVLAILMSILLVIGCTVLTASAEEIDLKARFLEWYAREYPNGYYGEDCFYRGELYRHTAEDGSMDWALIEADSIALEWEIDMQLGDLIIHSADEGTLFRFNIGVYDAAQDTFVDLYEIRNDCSAYPGLEESLKELKLGRPVGDADADKELTVLDATKIQRVIAELENARDLEYDGYALYNAYAPSFAEVFDYKCFADFDQDGDINIVDATGIQRRLAGLPTGQQPAQIQEELN